MHIDFATFKVLVEGNSYDDVIVKCIDTKMWSELWEDYLSEAKKFSSKQKIAIFGNEDWSFNIPNLSHKDTLNGSDKKLIGEFLRRNHARLAQEIAIKGGIIGKENTLFPFASNMDPLTVKIVGIVARSHGMALRDTFNYLREIADESWKKPANINAVFLMVVLRLADYFQIDAARVDPNLLKLKTFSSPISELEHSKHLSIESVGELPDDPETLFVLARPNTSLIHLKLVELFRDIQNELDLSWAVLGEIYGKDNASKQPKIKYRRISSNLRKGSPFYNSINYVPEKMMFEADQELIKLLISPLYGNNPSYGVRELLQNSLDACKERDFEENKKCNFDYNPSIKVTIDYSVEVPYFKICDNGKGMNLFEIKNYFLKAGASFRKSLEWKDSYTDENGKPLVERTGQFGVGVLAAFLIGQEIEVTTKNFKEDIGYKFHAFLDSEQIEIVKVLDVEVGTTIRIKMNFDKLNALLRETPIWYQWYRLKSPRIDYEIINRKETRTVQQSHKDPAKGEQLSDIWQKIEVNEFGEIHWIYPHNLNSNAKGLSRLNYTTCNGILIPKGIPIDNLNKEKQVIQIPPRINIFDNYGKLPLTLSRDSIDGQTGFENLLIEDISKDFIAKLLMFRPDDSIKENTINVSNQRFNHPCSGISYAIYLNQAGFMINYYSMRRKNMDKFKYIKLNIEGSKTPVTIKILKNIDLKDYMFFSENKNFSPIASYKEAIDPYYYNSGGLIYLQEKFYEEVFQSGRQFVRTKFHSGHRFMARYENWVKISYQSNDKGLLGINDIEGKDKLHSMIVFSGKHLVAMNGVTNGLLLLNSLFDKYFVDNFIIPYDMEEREKAFELAFTDLEPYMRKYRNKT